MVSMTPTAFMYVTQMLYSFYIVYFLYIVVRAFPSIGPENIIKHNIHLCLSSSKILIRGHFFCSDFVESLSSSINTRSVVVNTLMCDTFIDLEKSWIFKYPPGQSIVRADKAENLPIWVSSQYLGAFLVSTAFVFCFFLINLSLSTT